MTSFKMGNRSLGADAPPFMIAEMSGNHNQSLEVALPIASPWCTAVRCMSPRTWPPESLSPSPICGPFVQVWGLLPNALNPLWVAAPPGHPGAERRWIGHWSNNLL
jgi:hypothetical protein